MLECERCQCEVARVTEQDFAENIRDAAREILCDECWEFKWFDKVSQ